MRWLAIGFGVISILGGLALFGFTVIGATITASTGGSGSEPITYWLMGLSVAVVAFGTAMVVAGAAMRSP
jgi:hypothetical protein